MKVLAKGNGSAGWSKEMECTGKGNEGVGCGAKLLVEENDLWYVVAYSWGEAESYITFICPECGCMTDISNVPSMVVEGARNRAAGQVSPQYIKSAASRVKNERMMNRGQDQKLANT